MIDFKLCTFNQLNDCAVQTYLPGLYFRFRMYLCGENSPHFHSLKGLIKITNTKSAAYNQKGNMLLIFVVFSQIQVNRDKKN